jgi:hypothetical protein
MKTARVAQPAGSTWDAFEPELGDSPYAIPGKNVRSFGPMPPATSKLALSSMICGILAWTMFPVLAAIPAIILGHLGRSEIRDSGGRVTGDGMALFGMIIGYIQLAVIALILMFVLFFVVMVGLRPH